MKFINLILLGVVLSVLSSCVPPEYDDPVDIPFDKMQYYDQNK